MRRRDFVTHGNSVCRYRALRRVSVLRRSFLPDSYILKGWCFMIQSSAAAVKASKKKKYLLYHPLTGYAFVGLWLIGFLAFSLFPLMFTFIISFFQWGFVDTPVFVGFRNYIQMFTLDAMFRKSLQVTFTYAFVSVPLSLAVSLMLALLLNVKVKGLGIFRTLFYLPSLITGVAISVVWMWMLQPDFGIVNYFLSLFGVTGPDWLGSTRWALFSMIIMSIWSSSGSQVVIYLAGLQNVPPELYEAASIDGATKWRQFLNITIPMLTPTIFFNLVMGLIGAFRTFTQAYVMTLGGPQNSTMFYAYYLWQSAFRDMRMGYSAGLSVILFLIIAVFTGVVFKSSGSWVHYETEGK